MKIRSNKDVETEYDGDAMFKPGDLVRETNGYQMTGIVVSSFEHDNILYYVVNFETRGSKYVPTFYVVCSEVLVGE